MKRDHLSLPILHPHAAGIDIGSRSHFVAIDQNRENVKEFGVYTKDHQALIAYLREFSITTIAMESTGSYWQTLFNALQKAGFEVMLVGGNQTKNVRGRKTDVLDCMWIQKLHSLGLLSGSFLLNDAIEELRTYYSHRLHLIEQAAKYISKMQKSLRLMNLRLDIAIRDIVGKSGLAIIEAILAGRRNPEYLASLVDIRVKKSHAEIAASLNGEWREELLYELRSSLDLYKKFNEAIYDCDEAINKCLLKHVPPVSITTNEQSSLNKNKKKKSKNTPAFKVQTIAYQYFKTDLYAISGISDTTVLCLLTNMGNDIHKFPTAKSFASWLRLVPNNKISGGRIINSHTPSGKNIISQALRQSANSIGNQKNHELTPFFKRIAYRKGRIAAVTATARKLAIILWNMITKAESYKKNEIKFNREKQKLIAIKQFEKHVIELGLNQEEINKIFLRSSTLTV
jgi:transposase